MIRVALENLGTTQPYQVPDWVLIGFAFFGRYPVLYRLRKSRLRNVRRPQSLHIAS